MDEQVREQLCELLAASGRDICTTPRTLGMLLRQGCRNADRPVQELEQALAAGCVDVLFTANGPVDEVALAEQLVARSGMEGDRARWAVATWSYAVRATQTPDQRPLDRNWASWNRLDVSHATGGGSGSYQRAIWHLGIVGVAGAVGGAVFGLTLLARGELAQAEPWRDALDGMTPALQVTALIAFGILGGFTGGLLGWIFGGGQSWTYDAIGGTTLGRLTLSGLGAFHGACIGVMCSLGLVGMVGVMPGALLGAGLGAFLGLLAAERMARFWWW
jgi:hypothetical protein